MTETTTELLESLKLLLVGVKLAMRAAPEFVESGVQLQV